MGHLGLWFGGAVILSCISSLLFRTLSMPWGVKFVVALLPVPAIIAIAISVRRHGSKLDEFERRLQLEALATAFAVAAIAFIIYNQFQVANMLGPEDWVFPWFAIGVGYFYGYTSAKRRYQ